MSTMSNITSPSPEFTGEPEAHSNDETIENLMEKINACNDEQERAEYYYSAIVTEFCEQLDISFEALCILLDEVKRQERCGEET